MVGSALDPEPFLRLARAIVDHKGREGATPPPAAPGRRVALAFWRPGGEPVVATASGSTLADAVAQAAELIASKVPDAGALRGRLELDLPTSAVSADLGLGEGGAHHGDGPARRARRARRRQERCRAAGRDHRPQAVSRQRGQGSHARPRQASCAARGAGWSRRAVPRRDARLPLPRRRPRRVGCARRRAPRLPWHGRASRAGQTPERLLAAVRRGADYLVRILKPEGRYVYMYHPLDDRDDRAYGWLRHAGTTYALLEAYEELARPRTWRRPSSRSVPAGAPARRRREPGQVRARHATTRSSRRSAARARPARVRQARGGDGRARPSSRRCARSPASS